MRTATPDWVITFTWFVAGIGATGAFWYFLSTGNNNSAIWTAIATFLVVLLAILLNARNLSIAKEVFLKSLFFRQLDSYFVEVSHGKYQAGLVVHVLNEDGTKALRFNGVQFDGSFILKPAAGGFYLKSIEIHEAKALIFGKYYLSPGAESSLYMLLPPVFEMSIEHGGVPELQFGGKMTFIFGDTVYPSQPQNLATLGVISLAKWSQLSAS